MKRFFIIISSVLFFIVSAKVIKAYDDQPGYQYFRGVVEEVSNESNNTDTYQFSQTLKIKILNGDLIGNEI